MHALWSLSPALAALSGQTQNARNGHGLLPCPFYGHTPHLLVGFGALQLPRQLTTAHPFPRPTAGPTPLHFAS